MIEHSDAQLFSELLKKAFPGLPQNLTALTIRLKPDSPVLVECSYIPSIDRDNAEEMFAAFELVKKVIP